MRVFAGALFALGLAAAAPGAALAGDCHADLETRIAELEAATARKGNRKVSLNIAGQVNKALLIWDDGRGRNTCVAGNTNDQTKLSISGDARFAPGDFAGLNPSMLAGDRIFEPPRAADYC
ncbi:MAG: hypothetical protein ABL907_08035 [Hyphomicrobium sp.]